MEILFLDYELVLAIHVKVIENFGGCHGVRDENLVHSALSRIDSIVSYEGLDDICEIAALYAVAIAQGHPFIDGNKRTAASSMASFLDVNGIILTFEQTDLENIMVDVAEKKISRTELAQLLKKYSLSKPLMVS